MKKIISLSLLLLVIAACGQGQQKIKTKLQLDYNKLIPKNLNGGLIIYAVGMNGNHMSFPIKTSAPTTATIDAYNDTYEFYAIGFPNNALDSGTPFCSKASGGPFVLNGTTVNNVDLTFDSTNCVDQTNFPEFAETFAINAGTSLIPLNVFACNGNVDSYTGTSDCSGEGDFDAGGNVAAGLYMKMYLPRYVHRPGNVRMPLGDFRLDTNSYESACISFDAAGKATTNVIAPLGSGDAASTAFPFFYKIHFYNDSGCTAAGEIGFVDFPHGINTSENDPGMINVTGGPAAGGAVAAYLNINVFLP